MREGLENNDPSESPENNEKPENRVWMVSSDGEDYCPDCWEAYIGRIARFGDLKVKEMALADSRPLTRKLMEDRKDQFSQCSKCLKIIEIREI
ncbi:MAG: hypothetical protein PHH01_00530 [Patescibacteria group bacterium]|nr:hypothetical protein [Patescibacteria group bacterium]